MEWSVTHGSQNLLVSFYIEATATLLFLIFLYLYFSKKTLVFELAIIGLATQTFTFYSIGPTVSPILLFSLTLVLCEVARLALTKKLFIFNKYLSLLFFAPFLLFALVFLNTSINADIQWTPSGRALVIYKFIIFYIKDFASFVVLLVVINRELKNNNQAENKKLFLRCLLFVSYLSAGISTMQILNATTINSQIIGEIMGVRYGDSFPHASAGISSIRVQALFIEPRNYGAFLAITLPFFAFHKRYCALSINLFFGIFTQSQTFSLLVLISLLSLPYLYTRNVRSSVFTGILAIGFSVSFITSILLTNPTLFTQNDAFKIISDRAISRVMTSAESDSQFAGLPMQADLELPVINYLFDNPLLFVTGYGFGGSSFIPPEYFIGQRNYEERINGAGSVGSTLGVVYGIAEFGIFFSLAIFIFFSRKTKEKYDGYLAVFLWLAFFFSRIDLILFVYLAIIYNRESNEINLLKKDAASRQRGGVHLIGVNSPK